jgi:hypothetical protein
MPRILFALLIAFLLKANARPSEGLYNQYIDYQINSGNYIPDFVLSQPYFYDIRAFKSNPALVKYMLRTMDYDSSEMNFGASLTSRNEMRYAGQDGLFRFGMDGSLYFRAPYITLVNRTTVDNDYRRDPLFAGDLSESQDWLYGRVNEAYIHLDFKPFGIFFGRTKRNWGMPAEYSLILSDWAYSYDHFLFTYTYKVFRLSLLFARLEQVDALDDTLPGEIIENSNKFLTGHRLDIAFSKSFQMAFSEMAVYGGAERDLEPAFLNPMTFYYPLQRNDQLSMNGLWAMDIFYKPLAPLTLYAQFLLDDIIVNNDPEVDDRSNLPDRLALITSIRSADLPLKGLNTSLTYTRVWNRTYQSRRTWENYHYRGLGLGYPCASCEELKLNFDYWGFFPFWFKNNAVFGRYGSVSISDLFPLVHESFPVSPARNIFFNELRAHYFFNPQFDMYIKIRFTDKPGHYLNRIEKSRGWIFTTGLSFRLGQ